MSEIQKYNKYYHNYEHERVNMMEIHEKSRFGVPLECPAPPKHWWKYTTLTTQCEITTKPFLIDLFQMQPNVDRTFFIGAQRDTVTNFFDMAKAIPDKYMHRIISDSTFSLLKLSHSDDGSECLAAKMKWPPR